VIKIAAGIFTDEQKKYILKNIHTKAYKTMSEELKCCVHTIYRFLKAQNIDEKKCVVCEEIKIITEFRKGRRMCKKCELNRDRYKKNAAAYIRNRLNKDKAIKYFGGVCHICKKEYPAVCYDFHHIDPESKLNNPSYFLKSKWSLAKKELNKCIMVCKNCHAIIHFDNNKK